MSLLVIMLSCTKSEIETTNSITHQEINFEDRLSISRAESNGIIAELSSIDKVGPRWWERFKKFVQDHIGTPQKYVNGSPICHGNSNCGPCPGVCAFAGIAGNKNGSISDEELAEGLRPLRWSILESSELSLITDNEVILQRKFLIQIPLEYKNDFIMNEVMIINDNVFLPDSYVNETDFSSIMLESGIYPAIQSENGLFIDVIVNVSIN